jgi:PleD family two-component response regulator
MTNIPSKKILVVDDDLLTIATMAQTLPRNGYQVVHTTDQDRAFKSAKKDRPDLIICNSETRSWTCFTFEFDPNRSTFAGNPAPPDYRIQGVS